jgi:MFS transporter, ACS family, tartrate transporter
VEAQVLAKVNRRLVPFLILCYFVAYLDRVNVGFAALTMNKDLGFSATMFGFGAGLLFIAALAFASFLLVLALGHDPKLEASGARQPAE